MIRQCSVSFAVLFATACSSNLVGATNGTSSGTGATTSAGTTSGNAACCSSACCSEQSTASSTQSNGALLCQDGTACYGSWYCQLEDAGGGGCTQADPCNGQSGTWSCGGTGTNGTSSTTSSSGQSSSGGSAGALTLSVPTLSFGVIGDTRPADTCTAVPCTAHPYPTAIINTLFTDLAGFSPQVGFVVASGDYQYNDPGAGTASYQIGQYYAAAAIFADGGRPVYPSMGNHECTGYTVSDCGPNNSDGTPENYQAYLSDLLSPLGIPNSTAYYGVTVTIAAGQTAKFLMVAPNAWDSTQQSWLTNALAQKTTYTFIVQHEANNLDEQASTSAPASLSTIRSVVTASGTPASGELYPVTLWMVGHTHNYDYDSANQQVINGLGGAPKDSLETGEVSSTYYKSDYAYMVCAQQSSGSPPAIQCNLYDYSSNAAVGQAFAVNADGTTATVE